MGITSAFEKWLAKPFDTEGSVWNWFLFFGLLLLIALAWSKIIRGYQAL